MVAEVEQMGHMGEETGQVGLRGRHSGEAEAALQFLHPSGCRPPLSLSLSVSLSGG
jgi:hypothetical protein